jgi:hypothetical protein
MEVALYNALRNEGVGGGGGGYRGSLSEMGIKADTMGKTLTKGEEGYM